MEPALWPFEFRLVVRGLDVPDTWKSDRLCRRRHWHSNAHLKSDGFVQVGDAFVHYGAVLVPLQVCLEALQRITPADLAFFPRGDAPIRKFFEMQPEALRLSCRHEVDECVSKRSLSTEINWQIEKVELSIESMRINELE